MREFWRRLKALFGVYEPFDLTPSGWWLDYAKAWGAAHDVPVEVLAAKITSAIVEGTNGIIWATETPEWDRDWFNSRGYDFPTRWVPHSSLKNVPGVPGTPVRLDV